MASEEAKGDAQLGLKDADLDAEQLKKSVSISQSVDDASAAPTKPNRGISSTLSSRFNAAPAPVCVRRQ